MAREMQALGTAINPPEDGGSSRRSCCFPCNISRCCPCFPSSLTKIQDWLHLVLVVGVFGSLVCLIQMVYELGFGQACQSPLCFKQWIAGVVVLPTTIYFIQTIGNYDEQLREKKRKHEQQIEGLIENFNQQVAEINEFCGKLTENANTFAAGRFRDKCDNFKSFVRQVQDHAELYGSPDIFDQLQRFVLDWFETLAGALLNPRESPLVRGLEDELMRCTTVEEICSKALRRLENTNFSMLFEMPTFREEPDLHDRSIEDGLAAPAPSAAAPAGPRRLCGASWVRLGCFPCCRRERREPGPGEESPPSLPVTFFFGFIRLTILSRSHANLLLSFLADILLIYFEMYNKRWESFTLVIINEVCIVSMLACFEQINEIAQLERQIHRFERRTQKVKRKRDEYKECWEKVTQLHDLWKFRTLPSLTVMGKVHAQLTDMDRAMKQALASGRGRDVVDERAEFLQRANDGLRCMHGKLGSQEEWRTAAEPKSRAWKESVGRQLLALENDGCEEALGKLDAARSLPQQPLPVAEVSPRPALRA